MQGLLWIPNPFITYLQFFMFISFIFGLCYGVFEIACNLYASNIEKRENKSMMSNFHAFWSLGVLFGSILTSYFLEINVSFFKNILIYIIFLLPINLFFALFDAYLQMSIRDPEPMHMIKLYSLVFS